MISDLILGWWKAEESSILEIYNGVLYKLWFQRKVTLYKGTLYRKSIFHGNYW